MFCKKCGATVKNGKCVRCRTAYELYDRSREMDALLQPEAVHVKRVAVNEKPKTNRMLIIAIATAAVILLIVGGIIFMPKCAAENQTALPDPRQAAAKDRILQSMENQYETNGCGGVKS